MSAPSPSTLLKARGGHMLRRYLPQQCGRGPLSIVGLGIFRARGILDNGMCCDRRCPEVATRWAAWLVNGELTLLGFCDACASKHLVADELARVLEQRRVAAEVQG